MSKKIKDKTSLEEREGRQKMSLEERIELRKKINRGELPADILNTPVTKSSSYFSNNIENPESRVSLKERLESKKTFIREKKKEHTSGIDLSEDEVQVLDQIFDDLRNQGILVDGYRRNYLYRVIKRRMSIKKLVELTQYKSFIKNNTQEIEKFQEIISINVTRFFRDRQVWDYIEKFVLLELLEHGQNHLNIWSAGCAEGAEAYTTSIMLHRFLKKTGNSIGFSIQATDINTSLLDKGRKGSYNQKLLNECTANEIKECFNLNDSDYAIKQHFKANVTFSILDLIENEYPNNQDLIFCRNVLIYIDKNAQKVMFDKFYKALRVGGFLVLGMSEGIFYPPDNISKFSKKFRIYRRMY
ncbi:MAG: protein-glutamate O-methyltransferase CheR [Candidatus Heimdallarchaeota archaeon]|nr:protein-glutamate O-methyltransferase CheR [Candidatus Heimdallarchaeota archaeon]